MDIDDSILSYTRNNNPLPCSLKPALKVEVEKVKARMAACEAPIGQLEEKISERRRMIRALEEEISVLQQELDGHKGRRDEHQDMIQSLTSTTSVVRQVPPEVIAWIITLVLHNAFPELDSPAYRSICSVSKLWRQTATSAPCLWRRLTVDLYSISKRQSHDHARIRLHKAIDLWLSRAGEGTGIALSFYGGRYEHQRRGPRSWSILQWIRASNFRIASLTLYSVFKSFEEMEAFFAESLSSLRFTTELFVGLPPMPPSPRSIELDMTMPNLDTLHIAANKEEELSMFFTHPSLSVIRIDEASIFASQILKILQNLPALKTIALDYCVIEDDDDELPAGRVLPILTNSITEVSLRHTSIRRLPHRLTCSMLKHLWLSEGSSNTDSAGAFGAFIRRCNPSNLTLHLEGPLSTPFLNTLFATSAPNITTLEVPSMLYLPLDDVKFVIPPFINRIQSSFEVPSADPSCCISKLAARLQDPSQQALDVGFGGFTTRIN